MSQYFSVSKEDDISVISFNRTDKDANTLAEKVLRELNGVLNQISEDDTVKGVVFVSGKKDQFIAGADIDDIAGFKSAIDAEQGSKAMQEIFNKFSKHLISLNRLL